MPELLLVSVCESVDAKLRLSALLKLRLSEKFDVRPSVIDVLPEFVLVLVRLDRYCAKLDVEVLPVSLIRVDVLPEFATAWLSLLACHHEVFPTSARLLVLLLLVLLLLLPTFESALLLFVVLLLLVLPTFDRLET